MFMVNYGSPSWHLSHSRKWVRFSHVVPADYRGCQCLTHRCVFPVLCNGWPNRRSVKTCSWTSSWITIGSYLVVADLRPGSWAETTCLPAYRLCELTFSFPQGCPVWALGYLLPILLRISNFSLLFPSQYSLWGTGRGPWAVFLGRSLRCF